MKKLLYILIALIVILAITGLVFFNLPGATTKNKDAAFSINASEVLSAFQSNEKKANKTYMGKVITVKGKVKGLEKDKKGSEVVLLDTGDDMANILCTFESDPGGISIGQEISVKGMCNGYLMDVVLNRCNIVK